MNIYNTDILNSTSKLRINDYDEFYFYIETVSIKGIHTLRWQILLYLEKLKVTRLWENNYMHTFII